MKEIKAYIKKHKLDEVSRALRRIDGLTGISIMDSYGHGVGWKRSNGQGSVAYQYGVKLEIICADQLAEQVVTVIEKAAHTGLKGDGKIYISTIEQAVRISTGERGNKAI
ncbi:MAG: P-II family nitrogen regulator [Desulfarculus sp.]|nr:P-II family nitrogen regulator [Pseudomonadota bacterium]MBU4597635.1 P-II family nitrogen regulator [Pseudomonadota bacterium]MBV1717012.1 P-II family nitrogen regulator [Desulfarculus sp.]MBV1736588.1 P-II family nitrogen regulator [Desulfarculus sp.]